MGSHNHLIPTLSKEITTFFDEYKVFLTKIKTVLKKCDFSFNQKFYTLKIKMLEFLRFSILSLNKGLNQNFKYFSKEYLQDRRYNYIGYVPLKFWFFSLISEDGSIANFSKNENKSVILRNISINLLNGTFFIKSKLFL